MREIIELAKQAIENNQKRQEKRIFIEALEKEMRLLLLSGCEMAELSSEREPYSKWMKRVIYAAIPELHEIAEELMKEGIIREYCEAADVLSDADKERIFVILTENGEKQGFTLADELKN